MLSRVIMQLLTNSMSGMAGLVGNKNIKGLDVYMSSSTKTSLVYKVSKNLMNGVEGKEVLVNNKYDEKEVASVAMEASKDVFTRTGVAGFPLLCGGFASTISVVKRGVERAGLMTIVYRRDSTGSCSEVEEVVEEKEKREGAENTYC